MPTALAIPVAVFIKLFGDPQISAAWEALDKVPSVLMLIMAISGAYLLLLPYIVRAQRKKPLRSSGLGGTAGDQARRGGVTQDQVQ